MDITMDGKWQTTKGLPVTLFTTSVNSAHPVLGIVTFQDGTQSPLTWDKEGRWGGCGNDYDLIPVPTKHEGWGILLPSGSESMDIPGQISLWLRYSREDAEYFIRQQPEKPWHIAHVTWED